MPAPIEVQALVEKFTQDADRFRNPKYNETQVRIEFVDPLFRALGWDVENSLQVVHEDRVSVVEGERKKVKHPDYGFRLGRDVKFYVEAKKPSVDLQNNPEPAYQVRRYGWSKGLKISVLTDFEEFIIYNCATQPDRKDKANIARVKYIKYTEFVERWDEIADLLSFEAVQNGSIEKFAQEELPKGTVTVDEAFLREMEQWRTLLAKDIALHNPNLTRRELNIAVQRTIDRLVFLRICEDRNIEPYARLYSNANDRANVYNNLKTIYAEAHDKYNSGLFDFEASGDMVSLNIHISDEPLQTIIKRLYYPNSPYEFSVLPSDILGQVYERFLGKVIELDKKGVAEIVEKPEVRKAGGVYYTPTYIVDYIVENTVGKLVEGKTPNQVSSLRVLDPACGSGSFLIGAYQFLMDWHLGYYSEKASKTALKDKKIRETDNPHAPYALTTDEKKRILTNNIYGVDLDQQAVEVSKLSLLLKMLEDETDSTARQTTMFATGERILPDLSDNIKWGNSLIGSDFYSNKQLGMFDDEEIYRVKAFDWETEFASIMRAGGFDAVIGNPPYVDIKGMPDNEVDYLFETYKTTNNRINLFAAFIEKIMLLVNDTSFNFSMIVPTALMTQSSYKDLRYLITSQYPISLLARLPNESFGNSVGDVKVDTVIFVFSNGAIDTNSIEIIGYDGYERISQINSSTATVHGFVNQSRILNIEEYIWSVNTSEKDLDIIEKCEADSVPLVEITDFCLGLTPYDKYKGHTPQQIKEKVFHAEYQKDETFKPLLAGNDVRRFNVTWNGKKWISYGDWLGASRDKRFFTNKRILVKQIIDWTTKRIWATLTDEELYNTQNAFNLLQKTDHSLEYVLALLNSKLMTYYHRKKFLDEFKMRFQKILIRDAKRFPIRTIDFDNPDDKAKHDKMVTLVQSMLELHKQLPELSGQAKKVVQQQIAKTDNDIDTLVYQLYDLTPEEIAIVEGE